MKYLIFVLTVLSSIIIISCNDKGIGPDPDNENEQEQEEAVSYNINVTVSPPAAGTISPSADSTYEEGDSVSLQANPAEGYIFENWRGDIESSDNPLTITVDKDYELTANFAKKKYELSINIAGQGTVSERVVETQAKEYEHGTVVELTAEADPGWQFVEWQGDVSSAQNPVQVTMNEAKEVTAVFRSESFGLTLIIRGDGTVVRDPDKNEYEFNETVELTAVPDEGWQFDEWQGAVNSTENTVEITIDGPKEVTAVFTEQSFNLDLDTIGNGTITSSPNLSEYEFGTQVELTANPAEGWEFLEWRGDVSSTQNPVTITLDGPKEVTAVFVEQSFDLTVTTDGNGTVTKNPDQSEYEFGTEVELTANPAEGWEFVEWQGDITSAENPVQVTMDEAKQVTAVFTEQTFGLTVATVGNGVVTKNPDQSEYEAGAVVELTAAPAEGWEFVEWQGDVISTENPVQVTMDEAKQVTAVFAETHTITATAQGNGNISIEPLQESYRSGSEVEVTAIPGPGWVFVRWEGDLTGSVNPQNLIDDSDKTLIAVFEREGI